MSFALTPAQRRELIDRLCDEFESQWRNDARPRLEEFVARVPAPLRPLLLAELLPLEFEIRARTGETPLEVEYGERFSEDRDTVAAAFQEFTAWTQESTLSPLASPAHPAARIAPPDDAASAGAADSNAGPAAVSAGTHTVADDTPSNIGRYRIVRRLGQGGMGVVYLAHDPSLDRQVALKLPFLDPRDPRAAARRFAREARAMAAIHHSKLCPIFDVGEIEGRPFLTMAFIDGQTLADRLAEMGRMPPQLAARIVATLASAVQTIHEAGIVHRDLKPTNVLVDRRGGLFITDFGLASSEAHDPGLTSSGMLTGSPAYMAPEQIETRDDPVGPQSDVYALGVILYELLCGRRPFDGSGMAILGKVSSGERPTPPTRFAPLPEPLESICLRALAFRSAHRQSSAAVLAAELQSYLQSAETVTTQSESSTTTELPLAAVRAAMRTTSTALGEAPPALEAKSQTDVAAAQGVGEATTAKHAAASHAEARRGRGMAARGALASIVVTVLATTMLFLVSALGISIWNDDDDVAAQSANVDPRSTAVEPVAAEVVSNSTSKQNAASAEQVQPTDSKAASTTAPQSSAQNSSSKPNTVPPGAIIDTPPPPLPPGRMWVLGLDGKTSYAYAPSLSQKQRGCVTVEAWVAPQFRRSAKVVVFFGGKYFTQIGTNGNAFFAIDSCAPFPPSAGNPKFEPGEWYHVAVVSDEEEVRTYLNGTCGQRVERMATPQQAPHPFEGFWIGGHPFAGQMHYHLTMLINEVRVSQKARYAEDFKPSRRLETDDDTLALFHCDEGDGVLLRDSSGREQHAQVLAPQWVQVEKP